MKTALSIRIGSSIRNKFMVIDLLGKDADYPHLLSILRQPLQEGL